MTTRGGGEAGRRMGGQSDSNHVVGWSMLDRDPSRAAVRTGLGGDLSYIVVSNQRSKLTSDVNQRSFRGGLCRRRRRKPSEEGKRTLDWKKACSYACLPFMLDFTHDLYCRHRYDGSGAFH